MIYNLKDSHKIRQILALILWLSVSITMLTNLSGKCLYEDDFMHGLGQWVVEQRQGGSVRAIDGKLEIKDKQGCTVWFKNKLHAPVSITYEATIVSEGGEFDRLSDLNCFWMASDPNDPNNLWYSGHPRTGSFLTYDTLQAYYVGYGGNDNSTTRFRRYLGTGEKPLLPEHDLQEERYFLKPNHVYQIKLEADSGVVRYIRDGELIFEYEDPNFLNEGWFGFRTVNSHMTIQKFCVIRPQKEGK